MFLGKQDLKRSEYHEQKFNVEKIIRYPLYRDVDDIPINDIGKFLLLYRLHSKYFSGGVARKNLFPSFKSRGGIL